MLLTSSIASEMAGPFQTTYNASKSFVQSLAEALRDRTSPRPTYVVTALMPSPTDTDFVGPACMDGHWPMGQGPKDDPAKVPGRGSTR